MKLLLFHGMLCMHHTAFNCYFNVVLQLNKGDYPKNLHVVFCPNKQRYFEPFMHLDFVLVCLQSFLFQIFLYFGKWT